MQVNETEIYKATTSYGASVVRTRKLVPVFDYTEIYNNNNDNFRRREKSVINERREENIGDRRSDSGGGWEPKEIINREIRRSDYNAAVAGELACLAGYMAGYLKAAGATCAPTGSPQYHPHSHPAMGVGTHPHAHTHPHPGAPHPGLPSPFALATHGHPHPHPLEHGLAAFPQGKKAFNIF